MEKISSGAHHDVCCKEKCLLATGATSLFIYTYSDKYVQSYFIDLPCVSKGCNSGYHTIARFNDTVFIACLAKDLIFKMIDRTPIELSEHVTFYRPILCQIDAEALLVTSPCELFTLFYEPKPAKETYEKCQVMLTPQPDGYVYACIFNGTSVFIVHATSFGYCILSKYEHARAASSF